ncbi:hypothetical protein IT774_05180 [Salinimonas marina]|uniref:Uncharacterized protein n=1 Tax=Salinimonas marina TaxID=2785918 RepID=A0A7S9DZ19_9ALTE|nr:hypothetical protein [Salinimonas marina]QPG06567.1 hypothetical protein IT774_05180 [Salinimonas marina]
MPPVAIAVASGIVAGITASSVVIGLAVGLGTIALTNAMKPEIPNPGDDVERAQSLITSAISPRRGIYGTVVVGGTLFAYGKAKDGFGDDAKQYHVMGVALAGHKCESAALYEVNGKPASLANATSGFHLGGQTTANSLLTSTITGFGANHIGHGITYAAVKVPIDPETLAQGLRKVTFTVKGRKVYDPARTPPWVATVPSERIQNQPGPGQITRYCAPWITCGFSVTSRYH